MALSKSLQAVADVMADYPGDQGARVRNALREVAMELLSPDQKRVFDYVERNPGTMSPRVDAHLLKRESTYASSMLGQLVKCGVLVRREIHHRNSRAIERRYYPAFEVEMSQELEVAD